MRHLLGAALMALALTSPVGAAAGDDLTPLSTGFDTPAALTDWREHQPDGFSPKWHPPTVEQGRLVLRPLSSGWFEDNQAGHMYRAVTGDFIMTADVEVRGTDGPLPRTEFSLAGILIRAPRPVSAATWEPGGENWLFFSIGTASPAGDPQYEVKSTTRSLSTLKILPARPGPVRLRVARQGELFTLLAKPPGEDWRVVDQMIRPDLPETLNVGLTAYADWGSVAPTYPDYRRYNEQGAAAQGADLIAFVDRVAFRRPATGRFPIANLDAPSAFGAEIIAARRADLMTD